MRFSPWPKFIQFGGFETKEQFEEYVAAFENKAKDWLGPGSRAEWIDKPGIEFQKPALLAFRIFSRQETQTWNIHYSSQLTPAHVLLSLVDVRGREVCGWNDGLSMPLVRRVLEGGFADIAMGYAAGSGLFNQFERIAPSLFCRAILGTRSALYVYGKLWSKHLTKDIPARPLLAAISDVYNLSKVPDEIAMIRDRWLALREVLTEGDGLARHKVVSGAAKLRQQ